MFHAETSRRSLFRAPAAAAAVAGLAGTPAFARAPLLGSQAPGFYRFKIGTIEATIVSDGVLPLGAATDAFSGTPKDDITSLLTAAFLPPAVRVDENILVLNTGKQLILFDTGLGDSKPFGPDTGRLLKSLRAAGITPSSIDAVVLTHAHIDHVSGIMGAGKTRNFPNAQIYMSEIDYNFWVDPAKSTGNMKLLIDAAVRHLAPNRDRMHFFKNGEEFLPGIQAVAAPGHTIGHTMFMISQGGQTLAFTGDLTVHHVLTMEKPQTHFIFEQDPQVAAETRVKMLTMLAANRTAMLSYHFPWPGIGHVAKFGDGFRFIPKPMLLGATEAV